MAELPEDRTEVRPNWWVVITVCVLLLLAVIVFVMLLTVPAVRASRAETPLPGGWAWTGIVVVNVLTVSVGLWLCWIILRQALTRFTTEGVTQPRLLGAVHIPWSSVTWVAPGVTIASPTAIITVSPRTFRNPGGMIQVVLQRVPTQTRLVRERSFGSWFVAFVRRGKRSP